MGIPYLPKDSVNLDGKNKRRGVLFDPSSHPSRLLLDPEPSAEFSACLYDKVTLNTPPFHQQIFQWKNRTTFPEIPFISESVYHLHLNRNFPIVLLTEKRLIKTAIMSVLKWLLLRLN